MPKEKIQRAIERAKGKEEADALKEAVYEGFGPGGVAIIVEAATDNTLRTTSEIKQIIERNGGTMGNPGSVSYLFEQKGLITVAKDDKTVDDIFMIAADCGAEDVEEAPAPFGAGQAGEVYVYTDPSKLAQVKDALILQGLKVSGFELTRKPITIVQIADKENVLKVIAFMDKLEELDDVQKAYSNFDIPDALL